MIYLDNAATTYPKAEEVYRALDRANREYAFNSGRGAYSASKKVFDIITETRNQVAELVGASEDTVSFESSATEALNIIINGLCLSEGDTVYVSPFEHNAVIRPLYYLKDKKKIDIEVLPFDKESWAVDINRMNDMFALNNPAAVFVSHISNVTGYILPFEDIFSVSKKYGAINVLDCSQSLGVLNPNTENTDFVVFAGHKSLYASFGVAGFLDLTHVKLGITKSGGTGSDSLNHYMVESGYERYEAGSINSVAVAGLNASIKWLKNNDIYSHEKKLTEYLITELKKITNIKIYIPNRIENLLGIVSLNIEGYQSSDVGTILSEDYNICVRTGYHCSPFVHEFIGSMEYMGTVRISIGAFSSKSDVDLLINALKSFD